MADEPGLASASVALRLVRALAPVATLYVGKLIIDEVVRLAETPARPESFQQWLDGGLLTRIGLLLLTEFALTVLVPTISER